MKISKRSNTETPATAGGAPGLLTAAQSYPPLSRVEAATELGVMMSQRGQPNLRDQVPRRLVTQAEAQARGWAWFYDGGSACRYGHTAAKRTANAGICSDCERTKAGEEPIYGRSKAQTFYPERKPKDPTAPVVIQAPAPKPIEASAADQKFLAKLDELRDFDAAAAAVGTTRGQIEARVSSNEVFRKALTDLCERRSIYPDPEEFDWSAETERQLVRRFVDTGMLQVARDELRITASDYHARLAASPTFAAEIDRARPLARETLRDRATQAADRGKSELLKFLTDTAEPSDLSNMSPEQVTAELEARIARMDRMRIVQWIESAHTLRHKRTGAIIQACDLEVAEESGNLLSYDDANADLTS